MILEELERIQAGLEWIMQELVSRTVAHAANRRMELRAVTQTVAVHLRHNAVLYLLAKVGQFTSLI
jgi:hypothetical protein